MNNTLKFADLFSGIGGFRIAMEELGVQCVFSSEIDDRCRQVYEDNFGDVPHGDITKIDAAEIPDFDILTAGFPCQPFSYAGKLEGFEDKTRGTLFFDIVRILKVKKPKMFLLENVKGLRSHKKGETMKIILNELKRLGYTIYWDILNSYDFGVPQMRERWYCVGFDESIHFQFPVGNLRGTTLRDIVDVNNNDKQLMLSEFENQRIDFHFSQCPLDASEQIRVQHDNSKYEPHTKKGRHGVYSYLKPDKNLRFHIGDLAKTQIQEAYYCNLDGVAPTIIASRSPKLWDLRRYLSIEECKRLQGFPDEFKLNVSNTTARSQLGNAVSVPVVQAIAESMLYYYRMKMPAKHLENGEQLKLNLG